MAKYQVYGNAILTVKLGEYEAESEDEAQTMAESDDAANWHPTLCYQCAGEYEVSDIDDLQIFKDE